MTAQVCDVSKALLCVSKVVNAGNKVVFEKTGSYIEDLKTGENIYLKEDGTMYMLKVWAKKGF